MQCLQWFYYFYYFYSAFYKTTFFVSQKHRLWVFVRTASPLVPTTVVKRERTIYVLSSNKKNNVYSCKLKFYYIKVGFKGVKII